MKIESKFDISDKVRKSIYIHDKEGANEIFTVDEIVITEHGIHYILYNPSNDTYSAHFLEEDLIKI